MTLVDHLTELRYRIMVSLAALVGASALGFYAASAVMERLLAIPDKLVMLHPSEAFFVHLRLALLIGVVASSPVTVFQLLRFLFPGLKAPERRLVLVGLPLAALLFAGGVVFAYSVLLPLVYRFFVGFAGERLEPMISVSSYITFVVGLLVPFGLLFQLPLVTIVLTLIGVVGPDALRRQRKAAILVVFVTAAFLTPPDFVSQVIMAGPLIILYEISVLLSRMVVWRKKRRDSE